MNDVHDGRKMATKRKSGDEDSGSPHKRQRQTQRTVVVQSEASTSTEQRLDCMRRLDEEGFDEVFKVLQEKGITNKTLNSVTENQLKELGVRSLRMRIEAVDFIQKITDRQNGGKTVSDPIHGPIEMHPLCVKIIDTPQFQRLRFIKQLGGAYFVYPGAAHDRFVHSIGVSHLAGQLAISLKQQQPDLEISNTDILCVQIAGLCHDLGCGPFSHLFDKKFLPLAGKADITHEILSLRMFDHLVQSNDMESEFEKYGVSENDRIFIKEQIAGPQQQTEEWPYEGRCKGKGFLYEIVANKVNGIDVDKWDCFARDCHMLGIKNNFDHVRCITYARVLEEGGDLHICFKDKEAENFYDMFHTCKTLHRRAYQHPVGNIIETMIAEALLKAKNIIEKLGENGEKRHIRISEAVDDIEDYQKLTDSVFEQILWSTDDRLGESKNILMSIQKRQLYKCVGEIRSPVDSSSCKEDLIRNEVSQILKSMNSRLDSEDILIHLVFLDYGMSDKTPMDYVLFYTEHPNKVMKSKVSHLLPEKSAEQLIRCYCKKLDNPSIHQAAEAFNKWKDQHSCTVVGNKTVKSKKTEKEFDQNQYFWSYLPYLE